MQSKKLGLALGGGGSRALSHLGVLTALESLGIHIDAIAGSSMGSILGALYATSLDARATRDRAATYFQRSSLFGSYRKPKKNDGLQPRRGIWGWIQKCVVTASIAATLTFRRSLLPWNPAFRAIEDLIPSCGIEELRIPFASVALNLSEGRLEVFRKGDLRTALFAGASVGVVYPPYRVGEDFFVDAAPVSSVPVRACRELGVDVVIAVDIRSPLPMPFPIQHGFDVLRRIESIESKLLNDRETSEADLLLRPPTGEVFWGDFSRLAPILEAGERVIQDHAEELRRLLA